MSLKIVQDLPYQFKHFINDNLDSVIVVVPVDTVDDSRLRHIWDSNHRLILDIAPDPDPKPDQPVDRICKTHPQAIHKRCG